MRLVFLPVFAAALMNAHTLQITGVSLRVGRQGTEVTVVAHAPLFNGAEPGVEIPQRLRLKLDGEAFRPSQVKLERDAQYDNVKWTARENRVPERVLVEAPVFPDHAEDTTIVMVYREGVLVDKAALSASHPGAVVGETAWAAVRRFARMGVEHILSGADHILFLLGLILVGGPWRKLLGVVTAFTLAHSLTLSLTALGISSLSPRIVEPVIALSIAVVGLENLSARRRSLELRAWLAFGFGFFHGFGFAGALTEAGLPGQAMLWSLGAFNVGVEVGQAMILALVLPVLALLRRRSEPAAQLVLRYASLAIVAAGVVWFGERVWA